MKKSQQRQVFPAWHGSPHEFVRFDFTKLRDGLGVFFAADKTQAEHYGVARQYRLSFRNLLCVKQGKEYVAWLTRREREKTERDVRRRLMRDGYDGIRIEYDGGVVDYVAFSNRNIMPIGRQNAIQCVSNRNNSSNSLCSA